MDRPDDLERLGRMPDEGKPRMAGYQKLKSNLPVKARRSHAGLAVALLSVALVAAACGGDGNDGGSSDGTAANASTSAAEITSEEVCALLSDAEMESLVGEALPSEPIGPDSPNIGCSWNTGSVIVQVSVGSTTPVTAPGQECTPVDLGDEALECAGAIQFITNETRVRVSTDGFPLSLGAEAPDVLAVAEALEPKIAAR